MRERMNDSLPTHIAVIPDGNRRWAKSRDLKPWEGHRAGMERFREVAEAAFLRGIPYFTFWAASEDNLTKRSPAEVRFLVSVIRAGLGKGETNAMLLKHRIQARVLGRWRQLLRNLPLERAVARVEEATSEFSEGKLTMLFGYDGKREMLEAIRKLARDAPPRIDAETVHSRLWTRDLPPVDLVIRTGGEPHWSAGFMMWHVADSQFFFTETLWPDFDTAKFDEALREYAKRARRFGA